MSELMSNLNSAWIQTLLHFRETGLICYATLPWSKHPKSWFTKLSQSWSFGVACWWRSDMAQALCCLHFPLLPPPLPWGPRVWPCTFSFCEQPNDWNGISSLEVPLCGPISLLVFCLTLAIFCPCPSLPFLSQMGTHICGAVCFIASLDSTLAVELTRHVNISSPKYYT